MSVFVWINSINFLLEESSYQLERKVYEWLGKLSGNSSHDEELEDYAADYLCCILLNG